MYFAHITLAPNLPHWLSYALFRNGNNGVTVFFAISGFLITLTSIRRFGSLAAMRPLVFYRIRFARIAPLLLTLLAILSILHLTHAEGFRIPLRTTTLPRALFSALTFHLNWLEAAHGYLPANWDVLWSLSVEEMFYLFFPLLCAVVLPHRHGLKVFLAVLLAFIVMGPFSRTLWTTNDIWREKTYLGGMNAIALGVLTALLTAHLAKRPSARLTRLLLPIQIAGSVLILLIALWPTYWHWLRPTLRFLARTDLDDTLLPIATCMVMLASVLRPRPGSRWTAPIRWFGRHSYEVYLTHEFVVVWGTALYLKLRRGPTSLWVIALVLLTAPLGALAARLIADPLNRRLRPQPPTPVEPLTPSNRL